MLLEKNEINLREVYRYLGYKGQEPDEKTKELIMEVLDELLQKIHPKYIYKKYSCTILENTITFCHEETNQSFSLYSRNLAYNLRDCKEAYFMAATLGIEADKLLQKYEIMNMAKASIAQACGAACIERVCDNVQQEIFTFESINGFSLRPRFSAGYGDLKLEAQKIFFEQLDCAKRLGLTLTENMLMYPTKSVTAVIGVTKKEHKCHINKCKTCNNLECEFRDES